MGYECDRFFLPHFLFRYVVSFFDGNYLGTVKISENCPFILLTFQSKII